MLAGGIAQKGYQCGMLWGGSMAVSAESYRRFSDKNEAIAAAVHASALLMESFYKRKKTVNCRDISRVDWENRYELIWYMIKTIFQGFIYSSCFNLIVKWTPEAIEAAKQGLSATSSHHPACVSCASEVIKKMGATDEESMMVAGFAGGIGLSGNACGALSAVIWYKMLCSIKSNPEKKISYMNNPDVKKILRSFYMQTDSEMLCSKISGKQFKNIDEHSEFIRNGGCGKLIEALSAMEV